MTLEEMNTERALVVAAINDIISGKSAEYSVAGRSAKRIDLPILHDRLRELDDLIAVAGYGTNRAYVSYPTR